MHSNSWHKPCLGPESKFRASLAVTVVQLTGLPHKITHFLVKRGEINHPNHTPAHLGIMILLMIRLYLYIYNLYIHTYIHTFIHTHTHIYVMAPSCQVARKCQRSLQRAQYNLKGSSLFTKRLYMNKQTYKETDIQTNSS